MDIIANQPYFTVTRFIDGIVQYQKEEQHEITLSSNFVCTSNDTFLMEEVLDMSFRAFADKMGFLYLHTIKGMYSYTVKTRPDTFINEFKQLKS